MGSPSKTVLALLIVPAGLLGSSAAGKTPPAAPPQLVLVQPRGDLAAAAESVRDAGGRVELRAHGHLQALVPGDRVAELERDPNVGDIAPAPVASADAVTSGGVSRIGADALQSEGLQGAGVRIVVLDTAFGKLDRLDSLAGTELPTVPADHRASYDHTYGLAGRDYNGNYSTHGEEVAEILYDIAPAAEYWFVNYRTADEFGEAEQYVESIKPDVVVHSNSFLFGPFDGSGWFAKKVDRAAAAGILWVNSAGNYRMKHWEGPWADANADGALDIAGHGDAIPFTYDAAARPACDLSWTNPDPSGANGYTLGIYLDAAGTQPALDAKTGNPIVSSFVATPEPHADIPPAFLSAAGTYFLRVKRVGSPSGARLTLFCRQDLPTDVDARGSSSPTPGDARGALSVGAFNVNTLAIPDYSTEGPTDDGRLKPDLAAPTAVAVMGGYFTGTSAAAPHVGGEAALIWSQVAATSAGDVADAVAARLRAIALDSGPPGPDLLWGAGRTRVDTVPPALGPTAPGADSAVGGGVPFTLPLVEAGTLDSTAVALDGGPIAATLGADRVLSGSFDSHGLLDGLHQLTVSASDKSGNAATLAVPFRVDNTGPTLGATAAATGTPVSGVDRPRVPLVDPSGIATASATLDATPIASSLATDGTLTASVDTRAFGDGPHRILIRASDRLGNAATLELPLVVDNTPPRLELTAARKVLTGALYRVDAAASDALAGTSGSPRVVFGDGASAAAPATHRYRRSGSVLVRVTVSDRAGNAATVSRRLRVVELLLKPRRGAVTVTLGRRDLVRLSSGRFHLKRALLAGSHTVRLAGLGRGRHVVTVEARGFHASAIVRVP